MMKIKLFLAALVCSVFIGAGLVVTNLQHPKIAEADVDLKDGMPESVGINESPTLTGFSVIKIKATAKKGRLNDAIKEAKRQASHFMVWDFETTEPTFETNYKGNWFSVIAKATSFAPEELTPCIPTYASGKMVAENIVRALLGSTEKATVRVKVRFKYHDGGKSQH